jgi:N-acetyl-gamma-glutamyl-phosphate reductase common form
VSGPVRAYVLGGTGYVAGELLRLLHGHPHFEFAGIASDSRPGTAIAAAFPHLVPAYGGSAFVAFDSLVTDLAGQHEAALFCAAPHGAAAGLVARVIAECPVPGLRIVDISADHRFRTPAEYAAVYGHAAAGAAALDAFVCAVPEHLARTPSGHVAHPGCFATAMLLALVPLLRHDLVEPDLYISGVTGSTGSGRTPAPGTHHPDRHGDFYAYKSLAHRHAPEVRAIAAAVTGRDARVHFVPHSGPFARGIEVTLQARLARAVTGAEVNALIADTYRDSPFVAVADREPRVKEVAGSNYALLHAEVGDGTVAVHSVLDNLVKGAAGGALQWMNRLFAIPEDTGLRTVAAGWT